MKITILDGYTTNPGDLSWEPISALGQLTVFDNTMENDVPALAYDTEVIVSAGTTFSRKTLAALPNLKLLALISTGYSHVDLSAARELGIAVTNAPGYSTDAVAQHTIALLLELTNQVGLHNQAVQGGAFFNHPYDCFILRPLHLLSGKTLGIIGYGNIGRKVGVIAEALGMKVIPYSKDPEGAIAADVISLHCPLAAENHHMVDHDFIKKMKDGALLLNTARGGLIDEVALAEALKSGKLSGAGLDVLTVEPPRKEDSNPLFGIENCFITPHNAWMPNETRALLIQTAAESIESFLKGEMLNRVE
jgi:glycerate dehydrogenase